MRAQWRGQVIYYNLCCTMITPMPMKHHLICAKTAMKHFSKASVYNSGIRQWFTRARAMYIHGLVRAEQNKIKVCIWGDQVWDCLSFYTERMRVFILLRDGEDNLHSWSPTPPPRSRCPTQPNPTSSCRELHPTSWDSKSNNSNGPSHPDAVPGVRLNDQYLEGRPLIARGCAKQGGEKQSWSQVRVNSNGPDLPVVAM
jgi:hypothetical protein